MFLPFVILYVRGVITFGVYQNIRFYRIYKVRSLIGKWRYHKKATTMSVAIAMYYYIILIYLTSLNYFSIVGLGLKRSQ